MTKAEKKQVELLEGIGDAFLLVGNRMKSEADEIRKGLKAGDLGVIAAKSQLDESMQTISKLCVKLGQMQR